MSTVVTNTSRRTMSKGRLEAFSDGVIAIIITIMVLELKPPHGTEVADLAQVLPGWLRYALSFVYVGIYWVNHHALFDRIQKVDGGILWTNLHLLFWMSLVPYVTAWAGENPMAPLPVALYGAVLLLCSISFMLLAWRLDVSAGAARAARRRHQAGPAGRRSRGWRARWSPSDARGSG